MKRPIERRRPVVYLDVDGVLNAYDRHRFTPPRDSFSDFTTIEVTASSGAYPLTVSTAMGAALVEAVVDADVDWLTTWRHEAPQLVAPLIGLPDWTWLSYVEQKVEAIIADQVGNPRPFVWIDDYELVDFRGEQMVDRLINALSQSDEPMPPHRLVVPTPRTGLRPSEIQSIAEWMTELRF